MTVDATFFAALSLAAAIVGVACVNVHGGGVVALRRHSAPPRCDTHTASLRALAGLFLGLSLVFALLAGAGFWLERSGFDGSAKHAYPSGWGALWVYALLLVVEWRKTGLHRVGRRILVGAFLAALGVLALGIGFEVWLKFLALPLPACEDGAPVIEDAGLEAVAALGLTLVPLAGPALRLLPLAELPLSTSAATVAFAVWMEPALPALGWLPVAIGGGAPLTLVLSTALWLLLRLYARGGAASVVGLATYFALGLTGSVAVGTLSVEG